MLDKRLMVLVIFFISLVAISGVSAAEDAGDVSTIENNMQIDTITNDIVTDEISDDGESNDALDVSDNGEILTDSSNCYVNSSYTGDNEYGTENEPYKNLYNALNNPNRKDGDIIHIAAGEYTGYMNIGLTIKNNLTFSYWGPGEVVFDAQGEGRIFNIVAEEINLTGITFKNAFVNGGNGGAFYFENGLRNSHIYGIFINNTADNGGAIFVNGNITCTEIGADFYNNSAVAIFDPNTNILGGVGGAIFADCIKDCLIDGIFKLNNVTDSGGAIYALVIDKSNITSSFMFNQAIFGASINALLINNSKIRSDFVNNTALVGGTINANIINNTEIESNFLNNTADENLQIIGVNIIEKIVRNLEELGVNSTFIKYIKNYAETYNLNSGFGGAICVVGILENSNITGEFVNNKGADAGGAICIIGQMIEAEISGTYESNYAELGGALFLPVVEYSNIIGEYMNNYAIVGGAICANALSSAVINATFASNKAGGNDLLACGGAICIDETVKFSTIEGTFTDNSATFGAVIGGLGSIEFSNIAGYFINNHAIFGGAIDAVSLKYTNIAGYFINNTAGMGGAICAMDIDTVEIKAHFINNSAYYSDEIGKYLSNGEGKFISEYIESMGLDHAGFGGAIAVAGLLKNSEVTGDFILNSATVGGAIFTLTLSINGHDIEPVENNRFNSNFIDNNAEICAAIYINATSSKNKIPSNFINNIAEHDGIIYIYESCKDSISKCLFMNNTLSDSIILIDSASGTNITHNIFLNSLRDYDIKISGDELYLDNNWFGHNSTNYNDSPRVIGAECNKWLFLNASADPSLVSYLGSSNVVFNLFVYDNIANSSNVKFDHTLLGPVNLSITSANGKIDKNATAFDEIIKFSSNGKKGTVTVALGNVQEMVTIGCLPRLSGNDSVMDYLANNYKIQVFDTNGDLAAGEIVEITVNGITYTVKSNNEGYATLPVNLKPKTYIITSKYKGFILKNTVNVKNTLKAKKTFKVKKSTKKLVLKATLKWSNKTAIAKKKVSFKIKGKKFTKKTNKKGVSKIKLSIKHINKGKIKLKFKKKSKKLKVGKRYRMKISYKKETVKSKVVVKK